MKNRVALLDQVVGRSRGKRLNGEARICRTLHGQYAAITDKQIRNVMCPAEFVHHRRRQARLIFLLCQFDAIVLP
jgi:hypothetical protein